MSGGTFNVARSIWTHPAFADEPLTEREAFLWMVGEASYKTREVRSGKYIAETQRGQLFHSVRYMADAWQWSKSRVSRFLKRLEKRDTIKLETGTVVLLVTICDYEVFQNASDANGTVAGHSAGQKRDSSGTEKKKDKKYKKDITPLTPLQILSEILPEKLAAEFIEHRRKLSKPLKTERMANGVCRHLREIEQAGLSPSDAIIMAMEEGWQTVKLDYLQNRRAPSQKTGGPNDRFAAAMADAERASRRTETGHGMADCPGDVVLGPLFPAERKRGGIQDANGGLARGFGRPSPGSDREGNGGAQTIDGSYQADPWRDSEPSAVLHFAGRAAGF